MGLKDYLKFKIGADSSKYEKTMSRVRKTTEKNVGSATKMFKGLQGQIAILAGGYGLLKLSTSFLDASRATENYQIRLKVLLGSVEEGNRMFQDMTEYASKVPFTFEEIMGSATQLSGIMQGGVEEVNTWIPLIGDLAAASGLSIEKTTEQVVRMYSAGAASADLFRERGVTAMLGFQTGVSYSAEETRRMLMEAWKSPTSKFKNATGEMAKTWDGMVSMMSDKWFQIRNLIMEAGIYDELKKQLKTINDVTQRWIDNNRDLIKTKVPEYIDKIKVGLENIWRIISYDPAILEWGIVGLAFGGRKGAVIMGAMGHMASWADNLSKALGLAAGGVIDFSEIATANFKELEALVQRFENYQVDQSGFFFKIPEQPKLETPLETEIMPQTDKIDKEAAGYEASFNLYSQYLDNKYQAAEAAKELETEQMQANFEQYSQYLDAKYEAEKQIEDAKAKIQKAGSLQMVDNVKFALQEAGKHSKIAFKAFQAISIAEALVNTYNGATGAYKVGASIGGPPLGAAFAAAAIAAGLAQVSAIASMSPGSTGSSVSNSSGSVTTTSMTDTSIPAVSDTGTEDKMGQLNIYFEGDVRIEDETYIEELAAKISEAVEDREVTLIASNSQYAGALA